MYSGGVVGNSQIGAERRLLGAYHPGDSITRQVHRLFQQRMNLYPVPEAVAALFALGLGCSIRIRGRMSMDA